MGARMLRIGLGFIAIGILVQVMVWRPHLGLMDDANYFYNLLPAFLRDPVSTTVQYGLADISWGMWRPFLPAMAFVVYGPGLLLGGGAVYFWNAILVILLAWFHAGVTEKVFSVDRWKTLTVLAAFFYFHDLFQHPSLQEKMVLFFGALLLRVSSRPRARWFWWCVLPVSALGMASKASFSIYLAVSGWIVFCDFWIERGSRGWARVLALSAWYGALVFALAKIARNGTYTAAFYSFEKVLPNLLSRDGAMFLTALAGGTVVFWRSGWMKNPRPEAGSLFGVAAFLAIFLPWGIAAYIQSVIAPLLAVLAVQFMDHFRLERVRIWALALAAAIGVSQYRHAMMGIRLSDLGRALQWVEREHRPLYMPCLEGAETFARYLKEETTTPLPVKYVPAEGPWLSGLYLHDRALCPLPGRGLTVPGCESRVIARGLLEKSFRLVEFRCGST